MAFFHAQLKHIVGSTTRELLTRLRFHRDVGLTIAANGANRSTFLPAVDGKCLAKCIRCNGRHSEASSIESLEFSRTRVVTHFRFEYSGNMSRAN